MNILSSQYANLAAIKGNVVQLYLYKSAYPLSCLFVKMNIKPNTITCMSIISAILSFIALISINMELYFMIFWFFSIHLDYCDGTVARMTDNIRKSSFRFDHMSDILKIGLIILGIANSDIIIKIMNRATKKCLNAFVIGL